MKFLAAPRLRRLLSGLAVAIAIACAVLGIQPPSPAMAAPASLPSASAAPAGPVPFERVCPTADQGEFTCFAMRRTDDKAARGVQPALRAPSGFGPADLRSAYKLPAAGGEGQTIAVVAAFDNPNAEADLAVYRQQYGLPECTTENGCFRKIDQRGGTGYPAPDPDWAGEISLDLDMVSAVAPGAHILLVEADDTSVENLGVAVDQAVAQGAKYVSNSYGSDYRFGGGEDPSETTSLDAHYNHPGVAVVAASGDYGYGVAYPAASQFVTSVGGTSLVRDTDSSRGWSETAWSGVGSGPGSGCSLYEPKPAFQKDTGCDNRAVSDVSAVSDLATPLAVYQTYGHSGWALYGGTSAAAPIIAGIYALAGTPVPGTYPNAYPYDSSGAGINDITDGSNGTCSPAYLCEAGPGYDGPTGLGTPDGLAAFTGGPHGRLHGTVTDSVTGKALAGAVVGAGERRATSAADGSYTLPLPVGTHDLAVDAYGYATEKLAGVDITEGADIGQDFALSPVPSRIVSGKIKDGSGHGWPLYARIAVEGAPSGSVWTDPATGAYEMALPEGHTYKLRVVSSYSGYQTADKTVTVGDADRTLNVSVPADPWAGTARGYSFPVTGPVQPFDATSAPAGWSVVNAEGTKGGWQFDDPGSRGNRTGGTGGFATVDSEHEGYGVRQDTQLISPVYDLSDMTTPEFSFDTEYWYIGGETAEVSASTDNGTTWKPVGAFPSGVFEPANVVIPVTGYAGKPAVRFRFHFAGSGGLWWQLDNVRVGQRDVLPQPGALIVGNVKDANTGAGVTGANITSQDQPDLSATTEATPDDPALQDGFYSLFSPHLGSYGLTAAKSYYTTQPKTLNVAADKAVKASFELKAGRLAVTPSVSGSAAWGKQASRKLTVKNTGSAPGTLTLGERPGGFQIAGTGDAAPAAAKGAPLQQIKGHYSPLANKPQAGAHRAAAQLPAAGAAGGAWVTGPDYPHAVMDSAVGTHNGKIYSAFGFNGNADLNELYVLDPDPDSTEYGWSRLADAADIREAPSAGFIDGTFYAVGGWGLDGAPDPKLEIYDPVKNAWSTGAPAPSPHAGAGTAVLDGKLYTVGGCGIDSCSTTEASVYDPRSDSWASIAPYPEPIAWNSCGGLEGELYCAGGNSNGTVKHAYVYNPEANGWSRIADLPVALWGSSYSTANGLLVISGGNNGAGITNQGFTLDPVTRSWGALPNANVATYRGGGALGFYKVGGGIAQGVPDPTVELLPGFNQEGPGDVPWLSESVRTLTLQPGASTTVTVTLDASAAEITQPGDYNAVLAAGTSTPYDLPPIPVAFHVDPPKTWGKITGVVRGQTTGGNTAPIAGATVQIDSWAAPYSVRTAADGSYALWLDVRNNPLSVIAAKDGFQPAGTTAKLTKGASTTVNFTLRRY